MANRGKMASLEPKGTLWLTDVAEEGGGRSPAGRIGYTGPRPAGDAAERCTTEPPVGRLAGGRPSIVAVHRPRCTAKSSPSGRWRAPAIGDRRWPSSAGVCDARRVRFSTNGHPRASDATTGSNKGSISQSLAFLRKSPYISGLGRRRGEIPPSHLYYT